jgi:hypothetical protein
MKLIGRLIWLFAAAILYIALDQTRRTIFGADMTNVVNGFSILEMNEVEWREPLYWLFGKYLTLLLNNPWRSVIVVDMIGISAILYTIYRSPARGYLVFFLMLSPLFLLGFTNIHRQLIAFLIWILVERIIFHNKDNKLYLALHFVPFLIHSSTGILSYLYFLSDSIYQRKWKTVFALTVSSLLFVLLFGDIIQILFRGGANVTTGMAVYVLWAVSVGVLMLAAKSIPLNMAIFYVLGCVVSIYLFVGSAETSGSRFFIMIITTSVVWIMISQNMNEFGVKARIYRIMFLALLCLPTFTSDFSLEILRSAVTGRPYGTD